ncbi:MAG TPA: hypothetical protein VFW67_08190, partial [Burkholderiaceae bacterium]|nr:hypothetical protein [Burkholderiaceae bacterium]
RQLPVQEQLCSTHQEGVKTQEVIHTVSPSGLYPGWVNIGWKRWVRIRWKLTWRALIASCRGFRDFDDTVETAINEVIRNLGGLQPPVVV